MIKMQNEEVGKEGVRRKRGGICKWEEVDEKEEYRKGGRSHRG